MRYGQNTDCVADGRGPEPDLIAQWAAAARADGRTELFMAVSSLHASRHRGLSEAGVTTTSDPETLANWLDQRAAHQERAVVFVTLDSLAKVEQAIHSHTAHAVRLVDRQ